MVCTANELLGWSDFPKGLRVLLLDEDSNTAAEIRSKLDEMDYIVSTFCNEDEALSAISNKPESFHIAIVEVSNGNSCGRFRFLEVAKDLPTIMTSKTQCLTTMMECIALGAVEFLLKPLSDDKLRNIWQHVVHKAFNAGGNDLSKSLKPIEESVDSMIDFQWENGEHKCSISVETEHVMEVEENIQEKSVGNDENPAPPTSQLEQRVGLVDIDGDYGDQTNFLADKQSGETKSVDTTCGNALDETTVEAIPPQILEGTGAKSGSDMSLCPQKKDCTNDFGGDAENPSKASRLRNSSGKKSYRKKAKVDWTPELHKKFVQAVEKLGVDRAIPSRILELMKVEGLNRHNVASHLQKYRKQWRHILPKEAMIRRWPRPSPRNYHRQKPVMAFPPFHSNHRLPAGQVYPTWGHPTGSYLTGIQTWGQACYPSWQPTESWHWKPMHADAWGCPVMPPPTHAVDSSYGMPPLVSSDLHLVAEEVIDKVVKEAISKPWLPLPLGLNPPSTDCVLSELAKQGISTVPPPPHHINGCHPY